MEYVAGFAIALVIALTGVGAGTITAPLLILALRIPPGIAVGTALLYSAIVKMIVVPVQMIRRQVHYGVLAFMLAGGLPGVVAGSLLLRHIAHRGHWASLYWVLGGIIIFSSAWHIARYFRPPNPARRVEQRRFWIAAAMLPIGAEVGFSSSGAGALGTVVLLSLSAIPASQIVGTDLTFGLAVSVIGGGIHALGGLYDAALLIRMSVGGLAGAIVGTSIAPRVPNRVLRLALSGCLLVVGCVFFYRAAGY